MNYSFFPGGGNRRTNDGSGRGWLRLIAFLALLVIGIALALQHGGDTSSPAVRPAVTHAPARPTPTPSAHR
ncbi:MAG TPA: hypothetical protein VMT30_04590 [Candidatus Saccharimonadia bacterium]|nr:hypothetical protein [Candidatus Saccharimonadia bacterium]